MFPSNDWTHTRGVFRSRLGDFSCLVACRFVHEVGWKDVADGRYQVQKSEAAPFGYFCQDENERLGQFPAALIRNGPALPAAAPAANFRSLG